MRIRYVNGKVVIYDDINPAYTVMTNTGVFDNVSSNNYNNFDDFYKEAKEKIERVKKEDQIKEKYNDNDKYNQYYITCLPWIDFSGLTHPIPDNKESLSVPRICFGKYVLKDDKYLMMLNICVNHAFVDGFPLSQAFINIEKLAQDANNILNN